jgi:hypothetical protein
VYVSVALPATFFKPAAALILAGILGSPSARTGSTGGMDVRGVAFGPGLSSKWRAAVVVNARDAVSLKAFYEEVRMLFPNGT